MDITKLSDIFSWSIVSKDFTLLSEVLTKFSEITNDTLFHVFIYFLSLHVSSSQRSSSGDRIVLIHHLV